MNANSHPTGDGHQSERFVGSAIVAVCLNCLWQLELAIRHRHLVTIHFESGILFATDFLRAFAQSQDFNLLVAAPKCIRQSIQATGYQYVIRT
ncbi:MAG: hypothetical protein GY875_22665 [Gammaproteobacteria bacterium]|nr:hypothetical protein [Gammaproteobacteria bacterium]